MLSVLKSELPLENSPFLTALCRCTPLGRIRAAVSGRQLSRKLAGDRGSCFGIRMAVQERMLGLLAGLMLHHGAQKGMIGRITGGISVQELAMIRRAQVQ